jgi:hypothetical protein
VSIKDWDVDYSLMRWDSRPVIAFVNVIMVLCFAGSCRKDQFRALLSDSMNVDGPEIAGK